MKNEKVVFGESDEIILSPDRTLKKFGDEWELNDSGIYFTRMSEADMDKYLNDGVARLSLPCREIIFDTSKYESDDDFWIAVDSGKEEWVYHNGYKDPEDKKQKEYIDNGGNICPVCGSSKISADPIGADGKFASAFVTCHDCGSSWYDDYELTGFSDLIEKSPVEGEITSFHEGEDRHYDAILSYECPFCFHQNDVNGEIEKHGKQLYSCPKCGQNFVVKW